MSIQKVIERFCVQTAVYWKPTGSDGRGGFTFAAPEEINVRWSSKIEVMTDAKGKEFTSRAKVLLTKPLDDEGYLFLGSLTDLDSDPNPLEISKAFKIRLLTKTPMPRSTTDFVNVAYF